LLHQGDGGSHVELRIGDVNVGNAGGGANKAVVISIEKFCAGLHSHYPMKTA